MREENPREQLGSPTHPSGNCSLVIVWLFSLWAIQSFYYPEDGLCSLLSASWHPCWSSACQDKCFLVQGLFFPFVFCLCLLCKHFPFSLSPFWFLWLSPSSIVWVTLALVSLLSLLGSAVFLFFSSWIHSCTPRLFSVDSSYPFSRFFF